MTSPLSWVGVSLLTGKIIADLPGIELEGSVSVTLGGPESANVFLSVTEQINPDWLAATKHGGAALISYTGDPTNPTISWGGIVMQRGRSIPGNAAALSVSTCEEYLDGCFVGDYSATSENQDSIVADLMAFATGPGQIPFVMNHLPNASTFLQTVAYSSSDNVSVLSALQSLSAISGGPEWTITWQWDLSAGTIRPVFSYGARIGSSANGNPAVVFETADLHAGDYVEDYSSGYGANEVTAVGAPPSDATSGSVPSATATAVNLDGRPLWAHSYQPDSTVSDTSILADYAEQALATMTDGSKSLTLTISNDLVGKRFGVDWNLGDDIGYDLSGPLFPEPITGVSRVVGVQFDLLTVTPILMGGDLT